MRRGESHEVGWHDDSESSTSSRSLDSARSSRPREGEGEALIAGRERSNNEGSGSDFFSSIWHGFRSAFCCDEQREGNHAYEMPNIIETDRQDLAPIRTKLEEDYNVMKELLEKISISKMSKNMKNYNDAWNSWHFKQQRGEFDGYITEEIKEWREKEIEDLNDNIEKREKEYIEGKAIALDKNKYMKKKLAENKEILDKEMMDYKEEDMQRIFNEVSRRYESSKKKIVKRSRGLTPVSILTQG